MSFRYPLLLLTSGTPPQPAEWPDWLNWVQPLQKFPTQKFANSPNNFSQHNHNACPSCLERPMKLSGRSLTSNSAPSSSSPTTSSLMLCCKTNINFTEPRRRRISAATNTMSPGSAIVNHVPSQTHAMLQYAHIPIPELCTSI